MDGWVGLAYILIEELIDCDIIKKKRYFMSRGKTFELEDRLYTADLILLFLALSSALFIVLRLKLFLLKKSIGVP